MLHLRMISPPETTDRVLAVLAVDPGVTHVTLARGCAIEPAGDLVQADVAREAANDVIDREVKSAVRPLRRRPCRR